MRMITGRRLSGVLAGLVLATSLAGCATESGGVPGELSRAVGTAASAAASGELAVQLLVEGRTTRTATDIALLDMLGESQDAEVAAATLVVGTPGEAARRDDALAAIRAGTQAIVAARTWASALDAEPRTARQVVEDLGSSADALSELSDALEPAP